MLVQQRYMWAARPDGDRLGTVPVGCATPHTRASGWRWSASVWAPATPCPPAVCVSVPLIPTTKKHGVIACDRSCLADAHIKLRAWRCVHW